MVLLTIYITLHVFDEDFREYIDYDDTTRITSGSKIKVVRLTEATAPPPPPAIANQELQNYIYHFESACLCTKALVL